MLVVVVVQKLIKISSFGHLVDDLRLMQVVGHFLIIFTSSRLSLRVTHNKNFIQVKSNIESENTSMKSIC